MILKLLIFISGVGAAFSVNFFRRDYTYNQEYDAYYKMMWTEEEEVFETAFKACDDEGSQLFYPKDMNEWEVIKNLMEAMPITTNTTEVLVGIRDEVGYGQYITINGHIFTSHISNQSGILGGNCVVLDLNSGTLKAIHCEGENTNPRLFVCKKIDDSPCPTIDSGYTYFEQTKKCYKVNQRRNSWKDAMQICYMEGGLLAVVDSFEEANIIKGILLQSIKPVEIFYLGFRKISDRFYTLKGKRLEDSFNRWFDHSPPSPPPQDNHNPAKNNRTAYLSSASLSCGILHRKYSAYNQNANIYTSATNCADLNPFICEIQARF